MLPRRLRPVRDRDSWAWTPLPMRCSRHRKAPKYRRTRQRWPSDTHWRLLRRSLPPPPRTPYGTGTDCRTRPRSPRRSIALPERTTPGTPEEGFGRSIRRTSRRCRRFHTPSMRSTLPLPIRRPRLHVPSFRSLDVQEEREPINVRTPPAADGLSSGSLYTRTGVVAPQDCAHEKRIPLPVRGGSVGTSNLRPEDAHGTSRGP